MPLASTARLLAAAEPFRALAEHTPLMLWLAGPRGTPLLCSRPWRTFRTADSHLGIDAWSFGLLAEDRSTALAHFRAARANRTAFEIEYRVRDAAGRERWLRDHGAPWLDADGRYLGHAGCCVDITHQRRPHEQLQASEDQMRQLAARLQQAREDERAEVSRELHDELGQTLTALKLEINRAVEAFASSQHGVTTVNRLQSVVGLVDLGIATVKRISSRLRPATLDHLGLAEAIRWEALTFKARTGIRCQLRANRLNTRLDAEQQTALFRIVQEALNNVLCHANASSVHVTIRETDTLVDLRVRDNGRGISAAQATAPGSIGLLGMRERAALIGGTFKVAGERGKGTVVSVQVPIGVPAADRPRARTETRER